MLRPSREPGRSKEFWSRMRLQTDTNKILKHAATEATRVICEKAVLFFLLN